MASKFGGYASRVLDIDLSRKTYKDYDWSDKERMKYLGGKVMAAKIIFDNIDKTVEPLSKDNIIVVSTGPLTGTGSPSSSRFNISSISPLTNYLASSNCGGNFGFHLKRAGYEGVILRGKSETPMWIDITEDGVVFNSGEHLWGEVVSKVQSLLPNKVGKLVIGPAGENQVSYAGVFSQERAAGRAGLGAVFGYKNVKAITASGKKRVEIKYDSFKAYNKKWISIIKKHPVTGNQLPTYGTAGLVSMMQAKNILATKNFSKGRFDGFDRITGEEMHDSHLVKNYACITCPIGCGRKVRLDDKIVKGPELETVGLLGANILNDDLDYIIRWNYELDELGLDTISTAGTLAFAMELKEKGLLDIDIDFGSPDNISSIIHDIAYGIGIGKELGKGTKYLSQIYGGENYAIHSKGLELSAYEPRSAVGQGLGYAVSNRGGCHLNAGYMVIFEALSMNMDPFSESNKDIMNIFTQDVFEAISSSGCCLFTSYIMLPPVLINNPRGLVSKTANKLLTTKLTGFFIKQMNKGRFGFVMESIRLLPYIKALRLTTGMPMSYKRFKAIGERGYNLERLINEERGLTHRDDSLPKRLTDELMDNNNPKSRVMLDPMKKRYYKHRGWTAEGKIKDSTLDRLGLARKYYGHS